MNFVKDFWVFLLVLLVFHDSQFASNPEDLKVYQPPGIFKIEKKIIYGINDAEIYFSIEPRFKLSHCQIDLSSSHPDSMLIESEIGSMTTTNFDVQLPEKGSLRFLYRVHKVQNFSLASLTLKLRFKYPSEEVRNWIGENTNQYKDPKQRKYLMENLKPEGELHEEIQGIFLYGRRFLTE